MQRAQIHVAAADALEELHEGNLGEHAGELAYHFAGAQKVLGSDKLVYFPLIVGEQAIEAFQQLLAADILATAVERFVQRAPKCLDILFIFTQRHSLG